jgi:hypothetical protein
MDSIRTSVSERIAFLTLDVMEYIKMANCKVCFCIDTSPSVFKFFLDNEDEKMTYLAAEIEFVKLILKILRTKPTFIAWNTNACVVNDLNSIKNTGRGTKPSCIFAKNDTLNAFQEADVIVLITDGEINDTEFRKFSEKITEYNKNTKAVIGIIVRRRTTNLNSQEPDPPEEIDVSVLMPAMLSNGCIGIYNSKNPNPYVIWTDEYFQKIMKAHIIDTHSRWGDVTEMDPNKFNNMGLPFFNQSNRNYLHDSGYVYLGSNFFYNPEFLLGYEPSWDDFLKMPLGNIFRYHIIYSTIDVYFTWLKDQVKRFIDDHAKDIMGSLKITLHDMLKNETSEQSLTHIKKYIGYRNLILLKYLYDHKIGFSDTNIDFGDPNNNKIFKYLCGLINATQNYLINQKNKGNNYRVGNISINNYYTDTNSLNIFQNKSHEDIKEMKGSFNEPMTWLSCFTTLCSEHNSEQIKCPLCGEQSVPFVLIRKKFSMDDLNEIITNDPRKNAVDYFYPKMLCCKCATQFCVIGKDPVGINIISALPIVRLIKEPKSTTIKKSIIMTDYHDEFSKLTAHRGNDEIVICAMLRFFNILRTFFKSPEESWILYPIYTSLRVNFM